MLDEGFALESAATKVDKRLKMVKDAFGKLKRGEQKGSTKSDPS